jgi:hypothetical protein
MKLPNLNSTAGSALYGIVYADQKPAAAPKPPKDGDDAAPAVAPEPVEKLALWADLPKETRTAFTNLAGFLTSYIGTAKASALDIEGAAMAAATKCKDTPVAALKPNYRKLVEVFLNVRQGFAV